MGLPAVLSVLCLLFAVGYAGITTCAGGETKQTLLDFGPGSAVWRIFSGSGVSPNWQTTGFDASAWPTGTSPFSTNNAIHPTWSNCQTSVIPNDCSATETTLSEDIPLDTFYPHFLRATFNVANPSSVTAIGFEAVHDDAVDEIWVNGVNTNVFLPSYSCLTDVAQTSSVAPLLLQATGNVVALKWTNKDSAAYLHVRIVACIGVAPTPTPTPSPSHFPESGADPYFQDSHGHGFYANTEGLMLLCKTGRYTLQGHAVAACNASFLMSTTVWENETIPLSPECTRVKLQLGEAENIGHAMLGNPYSVIRKEFCVADDFKYTVYYVQVKPCGLVTQYLRIYDDCEEGWMSHKTYELYQYYSALEE